MRFLMGLNDSYLAIRGQILLYEPLPDINRVLSLILQEEKQRSFKNGEFTGSVVALEELALHTCLNTGGTSTSQPLALSASTSNYINNFSGKVSSFSSFTIPNSIPHSTVFSAKTINKSAYIETDWIIDTGATDHMVHSESIFNSFTCVSNSYVYLPNGEKVLVTHIGTVHINDTLIFADVLCVPSFTFNLISVSKLNKSQCCCLIFLGSFCFIQDLAH